jgi:hypothetical protein
MIISESFQSLPAYEAYRKSTVFDCGIIDLPKVSAESGSISFVNGGIDVSFGICRVYYLYDIPAGEERGGHAHRELFQVLVSLSGSFDVILNDGKNTRIVSLNRPDNGLIIIPGIWRELSNFSGGAIAMVLASEKYSELDYVRDINDYLRSKI